MTKSASKSIDRPNSGRRSFIWKAGAAVSAVLATAVPAISMPKFTKDKGLKSEVDRLTGMINSLEDEKKINVLHKNFENLLDNGQYENIADLFSVDGEVVFNGGIFKGKEKGIRRLFCELFRSGQTGRKMIPAPGFEFNSESRVDISQDRKTAKAQFPFSIQVGAPIISDSVLFKMARLQGGGTMKWWERGTYKLSYIRDTKDGSWKIKKLEFQTLSKADYKPGHSSAKPIEFPLFSKTYPEDPAGPDRLVKSVRGSRKV